MVITGAVHISQTLAPIGQLLGYDVTIVDPRTAFASIERFPDVKVIAEWPDVALPPLGIDQLPQRALVRAQRRGRGGLGFFEAAPSCRVGTARTRRKRDRAVEDRRSHLRLGCECRDGGGDRAATSTR